MDCSLATKYVFYNYFLDDLNLMKHKKNILKKCMLWSSAGQCRSSEKVINNLCLIVSESILFSNLNFTDIFFIIFFLSILDHFQVITKNCKKSDFYH